MVSMFPPSESAHINIVIFTQVPQFQSTLRMLGMEARNFTMGSKFGRVSDDFGIDSLKCKGNEMDIRSIVNPMAMRKSKEILQKCIKIFHIFLLQ